MVVTPFPGQSGPRRRPAREAAPLIEQLRDALAHLHDPAYLHQHPLLSGLAIADGRALRTQLLAAIERLRPETVAPAAERSQRVYQLMRRRYRDGLLVSEVRRDLKISHSEYHREHNRGMAALAALLSQEPPAIASGAHLPAASVGLPPAVIALPPVAAPPKGVRAGGLLSALPGRSPFIGRGPELDLLRRGFDEAAAGLGVRLVLIDGEPGVGKTRLGREAGGYAHAQGGVFLEGRYLREGAGPYAAWVEALRPALRLLPALDLALAVGPFATDLAQILPELPSLLAAFPLMVSKQPAAPAALTPADLRLRLYDGVTELLRSLARHWPVLLLLDDLQWAPDLALLAHVVRRMAGERILLLCAHREEELRGEPLLAQARADLLRVMGAQALALRALDAENTHQLVAAQLGAAPAAQLQSAVFDVTGGNPFFVEETLRGLIEDGAVRRADDGWTLVGAAAVRLSETVRSLLRERVARLGAPAAEALTRASVLGEEFTFTALAALTAAPENQLVDALERALAARLLVDRSEAGKERYLFADEQVHQALYDAIPTPRRRRLHLRAAQELEARAGAAPECEAQELARHFQAANAPEQGARYAFAAGQQAERLFAWPLALRWYRRALQQWEDVGGHAEQRAAALERLGDCCFASTLDASLAVEYYRKALTLYEGLENRRRIAAIHLRIGREYSSGANLELRDARQAFVHLEQARRILEAGPESGALCGVYIALAAAYAMAFEWRPAATWGRAALELGERLGQPGRVAQACVSLGLALALTGQPSEGLAVLARGRELAVAHQDAITADYLRVFTTLVYRLLHQPRSALAAAAQSPDYQTVAAVLLLPPLLAEAHMDLGDAAAALACAGLYQRTLETWGQGRDASASGELGYVQFRAGLWDEARPLLEDGFRRAQSRHDAGAAADAALHLGILLLAQRDLIGAEAGLSQADQFYTATENVLGLLKVLPYQCELLTLRGRAAEAEAALARTRDLMALGENWGGLPGLLALAEGLVHAAQERWSSAEAAFGQALAVCRQYELRWCEARVYDEWGRVLRTQDDGNQASVERGRALQEQAAAFWQTMGAAPWAERTRRGLADA